MSIESETLERAREIRAALQAGSLSEGEAIARLLNLGIDRRGVERFLRGR